MINPKLNFSLNFDHYLSVDEVETIHQTLSQVFDDDPQLYLTISRDNGFYASTVNVRLSPTTFDELFEDIVGRPFIRRLIVPAKYKQDFIDQAELMKTPELKITPFTAESGKEMIDIEFVDSTVFPDIKWHFHGLYNHIIKQEKPDIKRPSGPRFPNLKVED